MKFERDEAEEMSNPPALEDKNSKSLQWYHDTCGVFGNASQNIDKPRCLHVCRCGVVRLKRSRRFSNYPPPKSRLAAGVFLLSGMAAKGRLFQVCFDQLTFLRMSGCPLVLALRIIADRAVAR